MTGGTVRKRTWLFQGRKRSTWGWTLNVDGRQIRRQGFASSVEAQENLDAYRAELKAPAVPDPAPVTTMTLKDATERYLKLKARSKTVGKMARTVKVLRAEFGENTPLTALTASRVSAYREARLAVVRNGKPLSPAAINRPLALLRHLLRLAAREWEALPSVPHIGREKEPEGRLRWLTPEEATTLLNACRASKNAALVDLAELALYTGMRQSELLGLTWDRVDRSRGVVLLDVTKSGRRREVPLNGPADAVLARRAGAGRTDACSTRAAGTPSGRAGRPRSRRPRCRTSTFTTSGTPSLRGQCSAAPRSTRSRTSWGTARSPWSCGTPTSRQRTYGLRSLA